MKKKLSVPSLLVEKFEQLLLPVSRKMSADEDVEVLVGPSKLTRMPSELEVAEFEAEANKEAAVIKNSKAVIYTELGKMGGGVLGHMRTTVDNKGVHVKFRVFGIPVDTLHVPFEDIEVAELHTFSGIKDFGGWGVKVNRTSKAWTTGGSKAVRIKSRNRKKLCVIGSKQQKELLQAINAGIAKSSQAT